MILMRRASMNESESLRMNEFQHFLNGIFLQSTIFQTKGTTLRIAFMFMQEFSTIFQIPVNNYVRIL